MTPSPSSDHNYVAFVVGIYWVVSISMVYLNKVLLSNSNASIANAPMFLTWFQCLVTALICKGLGVLNSSRSDQSSNKTTPSKGENTSDHNSDSCKEEPSILVSLLREYPAVSYDYKIGLQILPLTTIFVLMVTLNNICLEHVEVSFYNIARSLSLVFNVIFTYLLLRKSTSAMTIGTLLIVVIGFLLGIDGEINLSLFGTIAGVLASIFVSLNSIYTSRLLPRVNNDKALLLFYNNFNASLLFIPLIIVYESTSIIANYDKFFSLLFWMSMMLSGIFGFAIGLVTVMQVKATSPLTHNISGTAKAAVQSILAFYLWGNSYTFNGLFGLFLVLLGSMLYAYVQIKEEKSAIVHSFRRSLESDNNDTHPDSEEKASLLLNDNNGGSFDDRCRDMDRDTEVSARNLKFYKGLPTLKI